MIVLREDSMVVPALEPRDVIQCILKWQQESYKDRSAFPLYTLIAGLLPLVKKYISLFLGQNKFPINTWIAAPWRKLCLGCVEFATKEGAVVVLFGHHLHALHVWSVVLLFGWRRILTFDSQLTNRFVRVEDYKIVCSPIALKNALCSKIQKRSTAGPPAVQRRPSCLELLSSTMSIEAKVKVKSALNRSQAKGGSNVEYRSLQRRPRCLVDLRHHPNQDRCHVSYLNTHNPFMSFLLIGMICHSNSYRFR